MLPAASARAPGSVATTMRSVVMRHVQLLGDRPQPQPTRSIFSTSAVPMTVTTSSRRSKHQSGSNACERRHTAHRPRRIQIRSTSSGARTQRQ